MTYRILPLGMTENLILYVMMPAILMRTVDEITRIQIYRYRWIEPRVEIYLPLITLSNRIKSPKK
jgi:hypothetical protein